MTTTSPFGEFAPVQPLADGYVIPSLALGVWQTPDGRECEDAVRWALELGYRHIDTAQGYGNESSVGEGFRQSGLNREEVFIATKFYPGSRDPVGELEASLERLKLDYVDLYLVHWPQGGPTWAWPGMERAQSVGYARSIGVSNFSVTELEEVLAIATTPPVVNQINLNPFSYRRELVEEDRRRNLVTEAYSPLGNRSSSVESQSSSDRRPNREVSVPGPDPLGSPARLCGASEVSASRTDRRKRGRPRIHALGRRHGRTRQPRCGLSTRSGPRAEVVVKHCAQLTMLTSVEPERLQPSIFLDAARYRVKHPGRGADSRPWCKGGGGIVLGPVTPLATPNPSGFL